MPLPRRYRYGSWRGGDDPLAAPFDVRAAVDEVGHDVLEGASLRDALRALLRRGHDGRQGLDALRRQVRKRRRELQRRGDLAGTLDRVRAQLDQVLAAERDQLAGEEGDQARLDEMSLDALPDDTATAVRELAPYDWHSDEARAGYERIREMLRAEVLDAQFAGMKRALEAARDGDQGAAEAMQAVRDMIADLNQLLGGARTRRRHRPAVRASSWTGTETSSPRTRRTPTTWSTCWLVARTPPSGCCARCPRSSATSLHG